MPNYTVIPSPLIKTVDLDFDGQIADFVTNNDSRDPEKFAQVKKFYKELLPVQNREILMNRILYNVGMLPFQRTVIKLLGSPGMKEICLYISNWDKMHMYLRKVIHNTPNVKTIYLKYDNNNIKVDLMAFSLDKLSQMKLKKLVVNKMTPGNEASVKQVWETIKSKMVFKELEIVFDEEPKIIPLDIERDNIRMSQKLFKRTKSEKEKEDPVDEDEVVDQ